MVNPLVEIGGKKRPINFGRNAIIEFERLTNTKSFDPPEGLFNSHDVWRSLTYAGLKWGLYDRDKAVEPNPPFTLVQVGDWLEDSPNSFVEIAQHYAASVYPESEKKVRAPEEEPTNKTEQDSPGKTSIE